MGCHFPNMGPYVRYVIRKMHSKEFRLHFSRHNLDKRNFTFKNN